MAEYVDEAGFRLPTEFLNQDMFMHKENFNTNKKDVSTEFGPSHNFPTEFPYEFDSFGSSSALSSPVESVVGSTETEISSDEEDFLAGLTRRLTQYSLNETQQLAVPTQNKTEKKRVMSGSPQSTLSGIGSWSFSSDGSPNGVSSPPTTPFGAKNDTWDLIYAAAGQVARLKMNTEVPKYNNNNLNNHQAKGLLGPARSPNPVPLVKNPNSGWLYTHQGLTHNLSQTDQYQYMRQEQVKQQCASVWGRQMKAGWQAQQQQQIQSRGRSVGYENGRCGRALGLPQSAWPPLQVQPQPLPQPQPQQQPQHPGSGMRAVFLGGSGVKRECAGTGVFLPRRYGNPPDSRKKSGCSTVLVPAKVVQALNLNLDDLNGHVHVHGHGQPRFNTGFAPDYDVLLARRNAQLTQQKRSLRPEGAPRSHEVRLPQEWTY